MKGSDAGVKPSQPLWFENLDHVRCVFESLVQHLLVKNSPLSTKSAQICPFPGNIAKAESALNDWHKMFTAYLALNINHIERVGRGPWTSFEVLFEIRYYVISIVARTYPAGSKQDFSLREVEKLFDKHIYNFSQTIRLAQHFFDAEKKTSQTDGQSTRSFSIDESIISALYVWWAYIGGT